jgi:hypothetical protein
MNAPGGQRYTHPMQAAPEIVRQRRFDRVINEIAIGYSPEQADNRKEKRWPDFAPHVRSHSSP